MARSVAPWQIKYAGGVSIIWALKRLVLQTPDLADRNFRPVPDGASGKSLRASLLETLID